MITNVKSFKFTSQTPAVRTLDRIQGLISPNSSSQKDLSILKDNDKLKEILIFGAQNEKFAVDIIKFLMGEPSALKKLQSKIPLEYEVRGLLEDLSRDANNAEISELCAKIFKSGTTIHDSDAKASKKISALLFVLHPDTVLQNSGDTVSTYFNKMNYHIQGNEIIHKYKLGDLSYTYIGETKNGRPHGNGTHYLDSNKECAFIGRYVDGVPVTGEQKYESGDIFEGNFDRHGRATHGKLVFANNDTLKRKSFEGDFEKGIMYKGRLTYTNGDIFTERFDAKGLPASGTLTYAKRDPYNLGDKFEGKFANGKPANGRLTLSNFQGGAFYQNKLSDQDGLVVNPAEFRGKFNDEGHPQSGELTFLHKRIHYTGEVNNLAQPHGKGTLKYNLNHEEITVNSNVFENGVIVDTGTLTKKGAKYLGKFDAHMLPHGKGVYHYSNNMGGFDAISGEFVHGKTPKNVTITYASGSELKGELNDQDNDHHSVVNNAVYKVGDHEYSGNFRLISNSNAKNLVQSLVDGNILLEANDSGEFTVIYQKDQPITIQFPNSRKFQGTMKIVEGVTLLNGSLEDSNGTIYVGEFLRNGQPHGKCHVFSIPDSSDVQNGLPLIIIRSGEFVYGSREGIFTTQIFKLSNNEPNLQKKEYKGEFFNDILRAGVYFKWDNKQLHKSIVDCSYVTTSNITCDELKNLVNEYNRTVRNTKLTEFPNKP